MSLDIRKSLEEEGFIREDINKLFSSIGRTYVSDGGKTRGFVWLYENIYFKMNYAYFKCFKPFKYSYLVKENDIHINIEKRNDEDIQCIENNMLYAEHIHRDKTVEIPYRPGEFSTLFSLCIGGKFLREELADHSEDLVEHLSQGKFTDFANLNISSIINELIHVKKPTRQYDEYFVDKIKDIVLLIYKRILEKDQSDLKSSDIEAMKEIKKYIDSNFVKDISQEELLNIAFMSSTKLKNSFKEYFGMNTTEYIQQKRINKAEKLIIYSDLSMREISSMIGYKSQSRFSYLFKRYKKISPLQFRKIYS